MADPSVDFGILVGAGAALREFKAGEVIFKEGDAATEFFVIQRGKVEIRIGNRLLGTLSDHDIFGEMALIDTAPRSATAIAATDVKLVPVGEK
jgi:CRP-like cAMP-binding protein